MHEEHTHDYDCGHLDDPANCGVCDGVVEHWELVEVVYWPVANDFFWTDACESCQSRIQIEDGTAVIRKDS